MRFPLFVELRWDLTDLFLLALLLSFYVFVAFDFILFVGEVEVGFDVVVSFPLL